MIRRSDGLLVSSGSSFHFSQVIREVVDQRLQRHSCLVAISMAPE
jgi:hypothetical protein